MKELFAQVNALKLDDPILNFYNKGDVDIPDSLKQKLARGLYKGKDDDHWK